MSNLLNPSSPAIFDADGFLVDPGVWSESLAHRIAQNDGLGELSAQQFELLHTLRHEYSKHGAVMALSHVCHMNGKKGDCMQHLFSTAREAWRMAGLPNPGEEAKA